MRAAAVFILVLGICCAQNTTMEPDVFTTDTPTPEPTTKATTTPRTTTTVVPANTTTVAPTTTTTTWAPAPKPDFYMVTKNGITCILFSGDFRLKVAYTDSEEKTKSAEVRVPGPGSNATSSGSCGKETQSIVVHFGNEESSSFSLLFKSTGESTYELVDVSLGIPLDEVNFPGAKDAGKTLSVNGSLPGLSHVSVTCNQSLSCRSSVDSSKFTAVVAASNQTYTATATALGFKLQAFNSVPDTKELQSGNQCVSDSASDLVPIAVGCALAALVLLVLVAYLIGRRKRASAYESV